MALVAITIDMPPTGELETSGDGTSPTQEQMDEETLARQNFLDTIAPYLKSLPERPPHRSGNVSHAQLLGRDEWSLLNHYLLLLTVDIWQADTDPELSALLPQGAQVAVLGSFESLQEWPMPKTA